MPELPEVQTITTDLQPLLPGLTIIKVSYTGPLGQELLRKSRIDLSLSLPGKKITEVRRLSKQLLLELSSGEVLSFHLRITGRILLRDKTSEEDEYTRAIFELDSAQELRFTDRNGLASADLLTQSELDIQEKRYGPEIIISNLTPEKFFYSRN